MGQGLVARNIPQTVEDRIRRRERRGRNIRIDKALAISYPQSALNEAVRAPNSLVWNLRYMLAELYGQTGTTVGDISFAVTANALTVTFGNNTGNGVFNGSALTWTDSAKTGGNVWTVDQWAGYYLKVGTVYYKILSNTTEELTLDLSKGEWIVDGAYTLVPFIPNMHKDGFLNPDTSADRRYKITGNTETVISVNSKNVAAGTVTTGDAGSPYKTFRDSAFTGYEDDALNGLSIHWPTGTNNGESDTIFDFTGATGEFVVTTGFTNSIDVSDTFLVVDDMLYAGSSSAWRTEKYYPLSSSDFTDANPEDIHIVQLPTANGAIVDSRMQAGYAAMYSVEVLSKTQRNISVPIEIFEDSLRIELTDLGTGTTQVLYDSGFRPAINPSVEFTLRSNTWHRMDIYLYVADGQIDTPSGEVIDFRFDPLSAFITTWRDATPPIPTNIVITGADTNNATAVDTMLADTIKVSWDNSIFLGQGGETEIWASDDDLEGGNYTVFVGKVPTTITHISTVYLPGAEKWYKIRHVSAFGNLGPYSSARRGIVSAVGLGGTQIDLIWVDNGGSEVFPNENGWYNDDILKAKITVISALTISKITFQEFGIGAEDLGSSSPATSSALVGQAANKLILVLVEFVNGQNTGWLNWHINYDKSVVDPFAIISIEKHSWGGVLVTYTSPPVFGNAHNRTQFHYDFDNTAPAAGDGGEDDVSTTAFGTGGSALLGDALIGMSALDTLYIWARQKSDSGMYTDWSGDSMSADGTQLTGLFEVTDLLEMGWNDGI